MNGWTQGVMALGKASHCFVLLRVRPGTVQSVTFKHLAFYTMYRSDLQYILTHSVFNTTSVRFFSNPSYGSSSGGALLKVCECVPEVIF